jgi:lupus La protein
LLNKVNEAEDSLVPLALLCSFERMRALLHLPDVSVDSLSKELLDTVAVILERSSSLHVDRENRRVGRAEPLGDPVEVEKLVEARSLHVKPFSKDWTMDGIFAWFDAIRPVRSVRFRRHAQSKDFKGEVFVEFDNRGVADEVRKMSLEWEGAPLKMQWKRDFIESKKASKQQLEQDAAFYQQNDQQANGDENIVDEEGFTVGLLLAFELDEEADASIGREVVKEELGQYGNVQGVDFEHGSREGVVRFQFPEDTENALAAAWSSGIILGGCQADARKLEGEEERDHWRKVNQKRAEKAQQLQQTKAKGLQGKAMKKQHPKRGAYGKYGGGRARGRGRGGRSSGRTSGSRGR